MCYCRGMYPPPKGEEIWENFTKYGLTDQWVFMYKKSKKCQFQGFALRKAFPLKILMKLGGWRKV